MYLRALILCGLASWVSSRRALSSHESAYAPGPARGTGGALVGGGIEGGGSALLEAAAVSGADAASRQEFPVNRAVAPLLHLHGATVSSPGSPSSPAGRRDTALRAPLAKSLPRSAKAPRTSPSGGSALGASSDSYEDDRSRRSRQTALEPVQVEVVRGKYGNMLVPGDWARNFAPGGLRYLAMGTAGEVLVANLARDRNEQVVVKIRDPSLPFVMRELQIIERLQRAAVRPVQNILPYYESRYIGDRAYLLMEGANNTLEDMLDWQALERGAEGKTLSVNRSLPILVDLLRGIRSLTDVGVVHCDLTEQNVLMSNGRALISGFGGAFLAQDIAVFGCDTWTDSRDSFVGSAFRQAPEMETGVKFSGASSNVWSVGLIFARMLLGYLPPQKTMLQHKGFSYMKYWKWLHDGGESALRDLDEDADGRKQIRLVVRKFFDIEQDDAWYELRDPEVQELLAGLLARDANARWSAEGALAVAERLCRERGIRVPPEMGARSNKPQAWFGSFQ